MMLTRIYSIILLWILCCAYEISVAEPLRRYSTGNYSDLIQVPGLWVTTANDGDEQSSLFSSQNTMQSVLRIGNSHAVFFDEQTSLVEYNFKTKSKKSNVIYPVLKQRGSDLMVFPMPEVIVKLRPVINIQEFSNRTGMPVLRKLIYTKDQFVLGVEENANPFVIAQQLENDPAVEWANPNLIQQYKPCFVPNDPLYPEQWHLHNEGQGGGVVGADINAEKAWDLQLPNPDIVIAVVDSGVDTTHPDLNIWTNVIEANGKSGVDDDGNGLIDDIHGWDFFNHDNDPNPNQEANVLNPHGTSVAGVAAARGNNAEGVAGAAFGCQVLPLQAAVSGYYIHDEGTANALRYAAVHADVINNSWADIVLSDTIKEALDFAVSNQGKRGYKGVPVLFSAGNSFNYYNTFFSDLPLNPGPVSIDCVYEKNESISLGEDRVFIGSIQFHGFDPSTEQGNDIRLVPAELDKLPFFANGSGDAPFRVTHPFEGYPGLVFESGKISDNEKSILTVELDLPETSPIWWVEINFFISSEPASETSSGDLFSIFANNEPLSGAVIQGKTLLEAPFSGFTQDNPNPVRGPALHPDVIRIGASTDMDQRAPYSQFGPELHFVVPSDGGKKRITTTSLVSAITEREPYTKSFGGTSAACALASGVFAMLFSANPDLSRSDCMTILKQTSDKIGNVEYDADGFHIEYGYGRMNMGNAVEKALQFNSRIDNWGRYD